MIGVDGTYGGTQPYYTVSPYHNAISSPGYVPVLVQAGSDIVASSSTDTSSDVGSSAVNRVNASSSKRTHSSNSTIFSVNPSKAASSQGHAPTGTSQGPKINSGTTKRAISNRTGGPVNGASSHMSQVCFDDVFNCTFNFNWMEFSPIQFEGKLNGLLCYPLFDYVGWLEMIAGVMSVCIVLFSISQILVPVHSPTYPQVLCLYPFSPSLSEVL